MSDADEVARLLHLMPDPAIAAPKRERCLAVAAEMDALAKWPGLLPETVEELRYCAIRARDADDYWRGWAERIEADIRQIKRGYVPEYLRKREAA